jgi:nucleotide-binding universal stress UspA family protein
MELLRQCPCPVWLVGSRLGQGSTPQILAAVHANPDDPDEQALNASILELALTIRDLASARLSIVQAWTAFGETLLKSHMTPEDLLQYVDGARAEAEEALSALTGPFGPQLADATVELLKGDPEDVITDYVAAHGIDLVVMGTVARSGLAGVVMGNTAERVLQRLRVSVLAVKTHAFKSPASD